MASVCPKPYGLAVARALMRLAAGTTAATAVVLAVGASAAGTPSAAPYAAGAPHRDATRPPRGRLADSAPPLSTPAGVQVAQRWARARAGVVAFAVIRQGGPLRGLRSHRHFPSASVVKAMLLVAELRRAGRHALDRATR